MAKPASKKVKRKELAAVELVPDAWPRFEKFIKDVAKAGPQHKAAKPAPSQKSKPTAKRKRSAAP